MPICRGDICYTARNPHRIKLWRASMNIVDLVYRNARRYPDDIAFVERRPVSGIRLEISWSAFNDRTNRLANALITRGVKKGDKVFWLGKNSITWL
jgi:acyl-CoA synthetase (AMP-forming)/AMP-acid ligase II